MTYIRANQIPNIITDDPEIVLDLDFSDVPAAQLSTAKVLFDTIGQAIGRSARTTISLTSNFYQLGGNSLNSIYTVAQLRQQGHHIGITEFITAKTLRDVLNRLVKSGDEKTAKAGANGEEDASDGGADDEDQLRLRTTALQHKDKAEVIE